MLAAAWTAYLGTGAGRIDEIDPLVTRCHALLDTSAPSWQAAFARLVIARVEAEHGRRDEARRRLVDAVRHLEQLPADWWVDGARLWAAGR